MKWPAPSPSTPIDPGPYTTILLVKLWPEWHTQAKCTDMGYEMFFGRDDEARPALTVRQISEVRSICATCPVFTICLTQALENNEEYGIWAGTTGRARRKIQKLIRTGAVTVAEVVEDYRNGQRKKYEGTGTPGAPRRRVCPEPGVAGLPAADGGPGHGGDCATA